MTNARFKKGQKVTLLEVPQHRANKYTLEQLNAMNMVVSYVPGDEKLSQMIYIKPEAGGKPQIIISIDQVKKVRKQRVETGKRKPYVTKAIKEAQARHEAVKAKAADALQKAKSAFIPGTTLKSLGGKFHTVTDSCVFAATVRLDGSSEIRIHTNVFSLLVLVQELSGRISSRATIVQTALRRGTVELNNKKRGQENALKKANNALIYEARQRFPVGCKVKCALLLGKNEVPESVTSESRFIVTKAGNVTLQNGGNYPVFVYITESFKKQITDDVKAGWATPSSFPESAVELYTRKHKESLLNLAKHFVSKGNIVVCKFDGTHLQTSDKTTVQFTDLGNIVAMDSYSVAYIWINPSYMSNPQRPEGITVGWATVLNKEEPASPYANPALYEREKTYWWSPIRKFFGIGLLMLTLMFFASCAKDENSKKNNIYVTYDVSCNACVVNATDGIGGIKTLPISGKWQYITDATQLDSVSLVVGISATSGIKTDITSSIRVNGQLVKSGKANGYGEVVSLGVNLSKFK